MYIYIYVMQKDTIAYASLCETQGCFIFPFVRSLVLLFSWSPVLWGRCSVRFDL
jgi:hypothetical protein